MSIPKVFFYPVKNTHPDKTAKIARMLLEKVIDSEKIILQKEVQLKVHPGEPGNTTFIKPINFSKIADYLLQKKIKTYFIETNTITGQRTTKSSHEKVAEKHGFTQIPFVVADGKDGKDHVQVKIKASKYFSSCMIGRKLTEVKQVIVLSHFKGHIMSGFGATLKMLGIGFASRQGKIEIHSNVDTPQQKTIDWNQADKLYHDKVFIERMTDYALAAAQDKQCIYFNFALSIAQNCDCDGEPMPCVYEDLGLFASTDPVAIDKACFDLLEKREGKKPFYGEYIFGYAEKIGLGSTSYRLINCD